MTEKEFNLVLNTVGNKLNYEMQLIPSVKEILDSTNKYYNKIPPVNSISAQICNPNIIHKPMFVVNFLFKSEGSKTKYYKIQINNKKLHDICCQNGDILFLRGRTPAAWNIAVYDYYQEIDSIYAESYSKPYIEWFHRNKIDLCETYSILGLLKGRYNDIYSDYKLLKEKKFYKSILRGVGAERIFETLNISRFDRLGIEAISLFESKCANLELLNCLLSKNNSSFSDNGKFLISIDESTLTKDISDHRSSLLKFSDEIKNVYLKINEQREKVKEFSLSHESSGNDLLKKEIVALNNKLHEIEIWSAFRKVDLSESATKMDKKIEGLNIFGNYKNATWNKVSFLLLSPETEEYEASYKISIKLIGAKAPEKIELKDFRFWDGRKKKVNRLFKTFYFLSIMSVIKKSYKSDLSKRIKAKDNFKIKRKNVSDLRKILRNTVGIHEDPFIKNNSWKPKFKVFIEGINYNLDESNDSEFMKTEVKKQTFQNYQREINEK
jgi:hypothetical protein